jgi:hypothetical protein
VFFFTPRHSMPRSRGQGNATNEPTFTESVSAARTRALRATQEARGKTRNGKRAREEAKSIAAKERG